MSSYVDDLLIHFEELNQKGADLRKFNNKVKSRVEIG